MQTVITSNHSNQIQQVVATIDIPTATAIVYKKSDPFQVLVGHSKKHSAPVLPGGKIDLQDLVSTSMEQVARNCIIRELQEEVRLSGVNPKLFKIHSDPERDNRIITVASLKGTLIEDLVKGFREEELVLGRYGVPDYVFLVEVDEEGITESEELRILEWVNCQGVKRGELGGGHSEILKLYKL